ncbi:tripartite tricarboxylate transporter substrate binding protein [Xenophilus sp. Marseille-Q4582]|uniref:Bug family tripartite tricarboxylate transporter substrate binding protein n=1 Tax=Xenophilus sp. Marseille-Q4582 TaxID=2866600 RepID=UPI001CE42AC7|nr:tripartite tricarboxylate transporter substrate binding protein [Xenophilus sp. Marseille-Q4582]
MRNTRRALIVGLGWTLAGGALAQGSGKPLRFIVPYPPGGSTDGMARQLAPVLSERLMRPVVVDNRPGGGTVVAGQALGSALADGGTVAIFDPVTVAINPWLFERLSYDPTRFEPISLVTRIPFGIMVHPDFPANNLKEFVAHARTQALSFGIAGTGNAPHLAMERFLVRSGLKMTAVPYRGGAPALQELLGRQIPVYVNDVAGAMPYIQSGKVKVIAVMSAQRVQQLPQVPTIAESGYPDFAAGSWFAIFAPAGTPAPAVAALNAAVHEALAVPKVRAWAEGMTLEPATSTPQELARIVQQDAASYATVVRELGLKIQ